MLTPTTLFWTFVILALAMGGSAYDLRDALNKLADTEGCDGKTGDIVFVLDESGSIWGPHFQLQLQFVSQVSAIFDTSPNMTHIGVMTFGSDPIQQFQLGRFKGHAERMKSYIMGIQQRRGDTKTYLALDEMRRNMFAPSKIRSWVPQVAIVITDGGSDDPVRTAAEARRVHQQGIHVMAIGVGHKILHDELDAIASSPDDVFMVDSYDFLDRLKDKLVWKACQVLPTPAPTTTTPTTTTTLPQMADDCDGHNPMDVVFSIPDDAGIIDTELSLDFIDGLVGEFELSPTQVQVAITPRFCILHKDGIHLREHDDKHTFSRALHRRELDSIPTHEHIEYLTHAALSPKNGGRSGAVPCGFIIVDNASEDLDETLLQVEEARLRGVQLLVIGVGEYVEDTELAAIAGHQDNWWHIPTFDDLSTLQEQVTARLCQMMGGSVPVEE